MKFGFVTQNRSLPFGKGDGRLGFDDDYVTNICSLIELLLRRTLVRSVRCSAKFLAANAKIKRHSVVNITLLRSLREIN